MLLRSGVWVTAKAGATLPNGESLERVVASVNAGCQIGLILATIVSLVGIAWEIRRIRSLRSPSSSPNPAVARAGK